MTALSTNRTRQMWLAIGLAVALTAVLQVIGAPLKTAAAPGGILTYEFAGSVANAKAIIASWDARAQVYAGLSLGLDFLYPPVYAAAIGLACLVAAPHLPGFGQSLARGLSRAIWLAAALDYVENIALIQLLLGSSHSLWPPLAWICAAIKFAIVLAGILVALVGGVLVLVRR